MPGRPLGSPSFLFPLAYNLMAPALPSGPEIRMSVLRAHEARSKSWTEPLGSVIVSPFAWMMSIAGQVTRSSRLGPVGEMNALQALLKWLATRTRTEPV